MDSPAPSPAGGSGPQGAGRAAPAGGLRGRVAAGSSLLLGSHVATRVAGVLGLAALARLLTPEDYGVVALVLVVVAFADLLTDIQISDALIRLPTVSEADLRTALTLSILRGALSAAAVAAAAPWAAAWLETPALAEALPWAALTLVINGFRNPRFTMFARELRFGPGAMLVIAPRLTMTAASVAAAFILRDYWALVIGSILSAAVATAMTYALTAPPRGLGLAGWRGFLAFGGWLTASGFVAFVNGKSDTVALGAAMGPETVGVFSMGENLSSVGSFQLAAPLSSAIYPALAAVGDDRDRLREAYLTAQGVVVCLLLPVGVGVALLAEEVIVVLAGAGWLAAAPVVQTLAPVMALGMLTTSVQGLVRVTGHLQWLFARNLLQLALKLPLIVGGIAVAGLDGLLAARIALGLVFVATMLALAARAIGGGALTPVLRAWRSFAACAAMAATGWAVGAFVAPPFEPSFLPALARAALVGAAGAAVYVSVHLGLWLLCGRPAGAETALAGAAAQTAGRLSRRLGLRAGAEREAR